MKMPLIAIITGAVTLLLSGAQADSKKLTLTCQAAYPAVLAGEKHTNYLKVGLTGFERPSEKERSPVNIALVLDRSGSMAGAKLTQAKEAARMAVRMLHPDDIFSFVTYDSTVQVVVPATKVSQSDEILRAIAEIDARGNTALFGGVSKGVAEVQKFLSTERVNSVILLSDGIANVGPSSSEELAELGRSLIKQGITVTTLGLGLNYNEDLMTALADKSDGIHRFIQEPQQLVTFFEEEFGNVMNVVAQQVDILIECGPEVRPVRVVGREAEIVGQTVRLRLNQIYSKEEKYTLLEVELPNKSIGHRLDLANVTVTYENLATNSKDVSESSSQCRYVANQKEVDLAMNKEALLAAVTQIATETNRQALSLFDQGKTKEAIDLQNANLGYIQSNEMSLSDFAGFGQISGINLIGRNLMSDNASNQQSAEWKKGRKALRDYQNNASISQNTWNLDDLQPRASESKALSPQPKK